jgi:uncharacterized protein (TIGR00369 family)
VLSGDKAALLARVNQAMVGSVPLNAALGLVVDDIDSGLAVMRLPYRDDLVGNPETGVLHGGVITALVDACSGLAVFSKLGRPTRIATLDLRIDYLKPATPGEAVRARAECYKLTRQIAFTRALAYHDDAADPIAASAGTFIIFDDSRSPVGRALSKATASGDAGRGGGGAR